MAEPQNQTIKILWQPLGNSPVSSNVQDMYILSALKSDWLYSTWREHHLYSARLLRWPKGKNSIYYPANAEYLGEVDSRKM